MRKVLVIGGNRYFGKRLVELLIANGDEVTLLSRGKTPNPFDERVKLLFADRTEETAFRAAIDASETTKWDLVYDQVCYSPSEAKIACDVLEGKTDRYIFTSTQSVYMGKPGPLKETDFDPFTETYQMGFLKDFDYGTAKRFAEAYFFKNAKFPVTAMRIPIVLGEDDYSGRLQFHVDRVKAGKPIVIENLNAEMSMILSSDAAQFLFWIGTQSFSGPINASSAGTPAIGEILNMISVRTGKKPIVQSKGDDADHTPFIGPDSSFLDTLRATGLGFKFSEVSNWLPGLIDYYLKLSPN